MPPTRQIKTPTRSARPSAAARGADPARGAEPARRPKKKPKRSPGPKGRIAKRTGDLRSKPDQDKVRAFDPKKPLPNVAVRHLKALGHHLEPVVQIGKDGITDALVAATKEQLLAHELIKVRVGTEAPIDRKEAGAELAAKAGAVLAQTLGRTLLLYKRHPHKPKIVLPRGPIPQRPAPAEPAEAGAEPVENP